MKILGLKEHEIGIVSFPDRGRAKACWKNTKNGIEWYVSSDSQYLFLADEEPVKRLKLFEKG